MVKARICNIGQSMHYIWMRQGRVKQEESFGERGASNRALEIPINGTSTVSSSNLFQYGTARTSSAVAALLVNLEGTTAEPRAVGGRSYLSLTHYPANCHMQHC